MDLKTIFMPWSVIRSLKRDVLAGDREIDAKRQRVLSLGEELLGYRRYLAAEQAKSDLLTRQVETLKAEIADLKARGIFRDAKTGQMLPKGVSKKAAA